MGIDLDGKVAIVTGAGRGIGRQHALALAKVGATVVVNDLGGSPAGEGTDKNPAERVVQEIEAAGGRASANFGDVSEFEAAGAIVSQAVEQFGSLDILVNNAGIVRDRMLVNMTEVEWDSVISVHLKGHFAPLHHAAAYWRSKTKSGTEVKARIINTSSPSGLFGTVGQANYGAAKAGIAALTVIAAQELSRYGVTVNCLVPNARTRMTEQLTGGDPSGGGEFDPMDPANISPLVVALASDEAQQITGQCFFIFGGVIDVLQSWQSGKRLDRDGRWEADEIMRSLKELFPEGVKPERAIARVIDV